MIVARIQGHPARRHLHSELVSSLVPLLTEVVLHESQPPSPWGGYVRCLSDLPSYADHLLVLQDDSHVCHNFVAAVEKIATSNPDVPVVLYLAKMPRAVSSRALRAMKKNERYITMSRAPFVPIVCVLWPKAKAEEFLVWATSGVVLPGHPNPRSDDGIVAAWMKATRQEIRVAVPSLAEHQHGDPSVKGSPAVAGTDRAVLLATDALEYEW